MLHSRGQSGAAPRSLYVQAMDFCIPRMERTGVEDSPHMERLGSTVAEDLLSRAFQRTNKERWKDEWRIFYTSKISSAILSWDEGLISHVRRRCKNLKRVQVVHVRAFRPDLVLNFPDTVLTLDFDGELSNRGKSEAFLALRETTTSSWLCDSEKILRSLLVSSAKVPEYASGSGLTELHLGNVAVKSEDLIPILEGCGNLRILKHYELASALYKMHSKAWRRKEPLPVYKLRNLDVDFSHVGRCRMSPEWVLAPDALHLAVRVCPQAKFVRVRFDCSTPNDVLAPLATLDAINEFSAVCVSSGERSLVDFADIVPVLEKHGPKSLTYLELKVIEEVEIHVVIESCAKLETLILSGCGYVTPPTCASYDCRSYADGSLGKLKLLFYADGDDFSWDHGVPECFWKATLLPAGTNKIVGLRGLFLEYPRMPRPLAERIFSPRRLPFPNLVALSLCRFDEIAAEDVASVCVRCVSLRYVRLSDCEGIDDAAGKRLRKMLLGHAEGVRVHVDR